MVKPLLNAITPADSPGLGFTVIPSKDTTYVDFAAVITAVINSVLGALVIYVLIVMPMNAIKARRQRGEEPGRPNPPTSSCSPRSATRSRQQRSD